MTTILSAAAPESACPLTDDEACPHARLEIARRQVSPPYNHAALEVSRFKLDLYQAQQKRATTSNPLVWLMAWVQEASFRVDLQRAESYKAGLIPRLPHAVIARKLNWAEGFVPPPCAPSAVSSTHPTLSRLFSRAADSASCQHQQRTFPVAVRVVQASSKAACACSTPKQGVL